VSVLLFQHRMVLFTVHIFNLAWSLVTSTIDCLARSWEMALSVLPNDRATNYRIVSRKVWKMWLNAVFVNKKSLTKFSWPQKFRIWSDLRRCIVSQIV